MPEVMHSFLWDKFQKLQHLDTDIVLVALSD